MTDEVKPVLVEQLCHAGNEVNTDMASDPELKQTQQDTANIFLQYFTQTSIPSVVESQSTGRSTKSQNACTPIKSKSRETHPKAVHSTSVRGEKRTNDADATHNVQTKKAVCVDGPLATSTPAASVTISDEKDYVIIPQTACNVNNSSASLSCSSLRNSDVNTDINTKAGSTRPRTLFLDVKGTKYKRGNSNSSGSSGKTTPAQDPPLFSPTSELVQSYPPTASTGQWMRANKGTAGAKSRVVEVEPRHQLNTNPVQCRGDPQKVLARKIADRLKIIGDQMEHNEKVEGLLNCLLQISSQSLTSSVLSWRRVQEIFSILSDLLKQLVLISPSGIAPHEDERWANFSKLWDLLIYQVTPWIRRTGGWGAFLRSTERLIPSHSSHHPRGTGERHSLCLSEVLGTPFLPQCQMQTVTPCTSEVWTHTPKLSRACRSNQTAPPLSRSSTLPDFGRSRVWSWSENGNMERDSCAEFEEDDDSPLTEPGAPDEDEMVFSSDDVDQEAGNQVTSSPYVVNSSHHNNSEADSTDYRVDSGIHSSIETLSLSLSPPHTVQFGIGDPSLAQRHHNTATSSSTSLGSFSSLEPGSLDSSRKNSITSQSGRRSSITKPHPHRAGHLKKIDVETNERTPTRPHSAGTGLSYQSGASHSGSEFMYSVGVGLSAAFIFNKVSSFLNK